MSAPIVVPNDIEDEKVLFLSDILPSDWMAAENAGIEPSETVAVWGCGRVSVFALQSVFPITITRSAQLHAALLTGIAGKIGTTFLVSHHMALEDVPRGYEMFHDNQNEVTKVVLKPDFAVAAE